MENIVQVPLTQGQVALIDVRFAEVIMSLKWYASYDPAVRGYYAQRHTRKEGKRSKIHMHRLVYELASGTSIPPGLSIDHINHETLDNRLENLRLATQSQQLRNRRIFGRDGQPKVGRGVSFDTYHNAWKAEIWTRGRNVHLGFFTTAQDGHTAYRGAQRLLDLFGESEL